MVSFIILETSVQLVLHFFATSYPKGSKIELARNKMKLLPWALLDFNNTAAPRSGKGGFVRFDMVSLWMKIHLQPIGSQPASEPTISARKPSFSTSVVASESSRFFAVETSFLLLPWRFQVQFGTLNHMGASGRSFSGMSTAMFASQYSFCRSCSRSTIFAHFLHRSKLNTFVFKISINSPDVFNLILNCH